MYNSGIFYEDEQEDILIEDMDKKKRRDWLKYFSTTQLLDMIDELCETISLYQEQEDEEEDEILDVYDSKENM